MTFQSIETLLRILVIYQHSLLSSKPSQDAFVRLLLAVSSLLVLPCLDGDLPLSNFVFDVLALLTDSMSNDTRVYCMRVLEDDGKARDPRLRFLFGYPWGDDSMRFQISSVPESSKGGAHLTEPQAFPWRRWEMMQEATPVIGENDTSLSLGLFGARQAVL